MPCIFNRFLHLLSLMKRSIVHNDNTFRRKFGNEILLNPAHKSKCINSLAKQVALFFVRFWMTKGFFMGDIDDLFCRAALKVIFYK